MKMLAQENHCGRILFVSRRIDRGLMALCLCLGLAGCSRSFWRQQANRDTYSILEEKTVDPRWDLPRLSIQPHPLSRFYDPYYPDEEPLPPDDPAAHQYMHYLDGKEGYKGWPEFGYAASIENPFWKEAFISPPEPEPEVQQADATEEDSADSPIEQAGAEEVVSAKSETMIRQAGFEQSEASTVEENAFEEESGVENEEPATVEPQDAQPLDPGGMDEEGGPAFEEPPVPEEEMGPEYGPAAETGLGPRIEDLTLGEALELSQIHNREYQTQLEDLYLTALDLTFDRFQFDVRYLGIGGEPTVDVVGETIPDGQNSIEANSRFGISQLLPSGAQLAVELANNTLWLFTGPDRTTSTSVISYSIVQPLLLGAGRKIVLEDLTQAERNVLYAARDLARFRKVFFTDTVSGYLGLLLNQQNVLNQRDNIRRLEEQLEQQRIFATQRPEEIVELLDELPEEIEIPPPLQGQIRFEEGLDDQPGELIWRGPMSEEQAQTLLGLSDDPDFVAAAEGLVQQLRSEIVTLEVAQLESRLASSRNRLRSTIVDLQDSLDAFKLQLGLPPDLPIDIDISLLEPFQLIDPQLTVLENDLDEFVAEWASLGPYQPDEVLAEVPLEDFREVVSGLEELKERVRNQALPLLERDFERVEELIGVDAEGDAADPSIGDRFQSQAELERVIQDVSRDRALYEDILTDPEQLPGVESAIERASELISQQEMSVDEKKEVLNLIRIAQEDLLKMSQSLQVIQIGLRVELITLQEFTIPQEEAVELALENRLDLKNARAAVMDARRKVEIAANRLEAVLDIVAEGDIRTSGGNRPLDFRGDRSSFRAGIAFTAPLDQISERNAYRAALIDYQRARRDYMAFEDRVKIEVRNGWRQLSVLRENFETAREAIRIAALQYDNAVEEANAPVEDVGRGQNQGLNLLNALESVLDAQNDLIGIWINYERNRLNIYRDMGIMEIDPRGVWNDEFYQEQTSDPHNIEADSSPGVGVVTPNQRPASLPYLNMPRMSHAHTNQTARKDVGQAVGKGPELEVSSKREDPSSEIENGEVETPAGDGSNIDSSGSGRSRVSLDSESVPVRRE